MRKLLLLLSAVGALTVWTATPAQAQRWRGGWGYRGSYRPYYRGWGYRGSYRPYYRGWGYRGYYRPYYRGWAYRGYPRYGAYGSGGIRRYAGSPGYYRPYYRVWR